MIGDIDRDTFFNDIVPFFEKKRSELLDLLNNEDEYREDFLKYNLVFFDNSKSENRYYLFLSSLYSSHQYFFDEKPPLFRVGFSTSTTISVGMACEGVIDFLRHVFVHYILEHADIRLLFNYFERLIKQNYLECYKEETKEYLRLYIYHLNLKEGLFAISAYRMNFIFPIAIELDASKIEDNSAENKKILITNKLDTTLYKGFDSILGIKELHSHFSLFNFTEDIQLYIDIVRIDSRKLISIIDLLKTGEAHEIYKLKKELINLNYSKGKVFEEYLKRLLEILFEKCYTELSLRQQVRNRGGIRIRDFIIDNINSNNSFLKMLENKGVEMLLFDAKNYSKKLKSKDIDTFTAYIGGNQHFGRMGIILSREGANDNCKENIFRLASGEQKINILVLNQDDLLNMISYCDSARSPIDIIKEKYFSHILQM